MSLTRPLHLEEIYDILNADWLYDLLPGDGQDDYILQCLRDAFSCASRGKPYLEPCKYCAEEKPIPVIDGRHILPGSVNVKCKAVRR